MFNSSLSGIDKRLALDFDFVDEVLDDAAVLDAGRLAAQLDASP